MLTPEVISGDLWAFFHAGHMATHIKGAVTVDQSENGDAARSRLASQRFDQAPVVSHDRAVGWVLTSCLSSTETVDSVMTPLDRSAIVSAQASVPSVLHILGEQNFVFTADKDGLAGFIVPSDLDRHTVRSYFYLLVAGIEMLLAEIVRISMPEERIVSKIHPRMRHRYDQACAAGREADPVEYLYIKELVSLFLTTRYSEDSRFWDKAFTDQLTEVRDFRNSVMHPTCSIAASTSPSRASELASWAENVAGRLRQIVLVIHAVQFGR